MAAPPRPSPESPWTRPLPRPSRAIKAEAISIRQFCELIGVSRTTVCRWIRRGYVKAYRVGPFLVRIPRTEVARMRKHRIPYIEHNECPVHTVVK